MYKLKETLRIEGISDNLSTLLIESIENITNLKDVADFCGLSKKEYETARRERNRKRGILEKIFNDFYFGKDVKWTIRAF